MGYIYEHVSNFGRSIGAPVVGLVFLFFTSFLLHLFVHDQLGRQGKLKFASQRCSDISVDASALFLSAQRTLIIPGLTSQEKRDQAMGCLYGWHNPNPANKSVTAPRVPNSVAVIGIVQQLFSILLIFLCILAIRAKFRIR
jgi:hypothetical protein